MTGGSVGAATAGGGWDSLGSHIDRPFQRATTIKGVFVAVVNRVFET
jgi:hypothetical protein